MNDDVLLALADSFRQNDWIAMMPYFVTGWCPILERGCPISQVTHLFMPSFQLDITLEMTSQITGSLQLSSSDITSNKF